MFVYFEEGQCIWSDADDSQWDKTPYYPAPEGVEVGTRCNIVDGVAVADPIPKEELDAIRAQEQWSEMFNQKLYDLKDECDTRIQTIPAGRRSAILQRRKSKSKTYKDTWQHFYQRCQNIRHDQKEIYDLELRQSATWVVERIETHAHIKNKIKEHMLTMSCEELQAFDPSDPAWGVNAG